MVGVIFPSFEWSPNGIASSVDTLCFCNFPNDKLFTFSVPTFSSPMPWFSSILPESYCGDSLIHDTNVVPLCKCKEPLISKTGKSWIISLASGVLDIGSAHTKFRLLSIARSRGGGR